MKILHTPESRAAGPPEFPFARLVVSACILASVDASNC